ncbi:uncharacterized protein YlxW (UPF0749 family) [Streptomyces olivoverticillatus]|uniref:Uncharacterized protein YlxW (UPF0749 family) n=1 Tax=Streptomyces olivoverticillatus TaxID=66427 RepID=A0A7W7PL09_9ACTN|nr:DUF881 domain-containing protein [Streptomyces olivoverticillatus]MBB4893824.1 uncharacterized protein YlxW (UPF0749 family) [Streptomyces olivoverticillatus]
MSTDDTPDKPGKPDPAEEPAKPTGPEGKPEIKPEDKAEDKPENGPGEQPSEPGSAAEGEGAERQRPEPKAGPAAEETPAPGAVPPSDEAPEAEPLTGRQRLVNGLWPPRLTRAQLTVALLLCVLGLGLAIQVRSTSDNSALRGARQEDLVRILDELDNRTKRLDDEKRRLESQRTQLESSSNQAAEARKQTAQKEEQLAVLAGTVAAQGPGIELTVSDSKGAVESDKLLDTIQELRAAGAEAIQINDVRVVADTYFSGSAGNVEIDGKKVSQPYKFKVIGKPQDLEPALNIPGGVVQTLEKEQAAVSVSRSEKIIVDALRPAKRPDYARSSSQ